MASLQSTRPRLRKSASNATVILLSIVLVATAVWVGRAPLLRGTAQLWIISSRPLAPADAVAVLGGGLDVRPFAAAKYFQDRLAGTILVSVVRTTPAEDIGAIPSHGEMNRRVLLKLGVPDSAIHSLGSQVTNTRDEALALRAWADEHSARSIIVPTEIFSARRVKWILDRAFAGSDVVVQVAVLDAPLYTAMNWWQNEQGPVALFNEVLKYIYYRMKY